MNKYICTANLTRDPELSFVPASGKAYCKFGIAVNYGFGDNKKTSFLNCVAFDKKRSNSQLHSQGKQGVNRR